MTVNNILPDRKVALHAFVPRLIKGFCQSPPESPYRRKPPPSASSTPELSLPKDDSKEMKTHGVYTRQHHVLDKVIEVS